MLSSIVSCPLGTVATFRIDLLRRVAFALGTLCASAERTVHMLDIPLRCVSTGIAEALLPAVACYDSETALSYILLSTSAISSFRSTGSDLDPIACRRKF